MWNEFIQQPTNALVDQARFYKHDRINNKYIFIAQNPDAFLKLLFNFRETHFIAATTINNVNDNDEVLFTSRKPTTLICINIPFQTQFKL